jgi:hypothetical protein
MMARRRTLLFPRLGKLSALLVLLATLAGCTVGRGVPSGQPTAPPSARPTPASPVAAVRTATPLPCLNGRLTVGDLPTIDARWAEGIATSIERARAWQADARPVQVEVGCQPMEPVFRWQGVFYSERAQSFFFSDTGQTEPSEVEPAKVPTLPVDQISLRQCYQALARGGIGDDAALSPTTGISVRLNTVDAPFGPPGIASDTVVYHVAIDEPDKGVRDLFVSAADWTIHTYEG